MSQTQTQQTTLTDLESAARERRENTGGGGGGNQGGNCALCGSDYDYNLRDHLPECPQREAVFERDHT